MKSNPVKNKKNANPAPLLGAHFSIAGGLHNAIYEAQKYRCTALQIFTKNASTWKERTLTSEDLKAFEHARQETGITAIFSHSAYLINLGSPEAQKFDRSCAALGQELKRSSLLGITSVIHHPGAHMGEGEKAGLTRIAEGINRVFDAVQQDGPKLLLETCAGQGTTLGHTFEQLAAIAEKVEQRHRIGFCLDTCHIFAAGYDIRNETAFHETLKSFDGILGLERLKVIHVNDALRDLGSRVDRHTHIGKGRIGKKAFSLLMNDKRLAHVPKILETPKKKDGVDWDRKNLDYLLALKCSNNV